VKWAKDVYEYIESVKKSINAMGESLLSPDDVISSKCKETTSDSLNTTANATENNKYWINLLSDKAQKHCNSKEGKDKWEFPFSGGSSLKILPINSYMANGAGLTTAVANANVIPTLDLAVLLPVTSRGGDHDHDHTHANTGMVGGKDYLNNRYFDKRNIVAIHMAKYLSQKKQRKNVGHVHIRNELDGDSRKISIILTPPLRNDADGVGHKSAKTKNRGNARGDKEEGHKTTNKKSNKSKVRFRVRLVFGAELQSTRDGVDANTGWIPSARLFPNRCNNKFLNHGDNQMIVTDEGTPSYNNALANDLHHTNKSQILVSTASNGSKTFTESWTLLKIWCLQRGFLRGHDTFSETCLGLTLAYLYRNKIVSFRMDSVQIFTVWLKFMSDIDWLAEKGTSIDGNSNSATNKIGKDTIRHSSNEGYQDLKIFATRGRKNRRAIVMPELESSEKHTILNCIQNRLYASEAASHSKQYGTTPGSVDEGAHAKTLLTCFKVNVEGPIFLDPTMTVNYFGHISPSFIRELQIETRKAIKCIHHHGDNSVPSSIGSVSPFRQLFLEHIRFWTRYDAYLRIDLDEIHFPSSAEAKQKPMLFWGNDVNDLGTYESFSRGLLRVLRMALGDRVTAIRLLTTGNGELIDGSAHKEAVPIGDTGTVELVDNDQILTMPIRGANESSMEHMSRKSISAVVKGNGQKNTVVIGIRINPDTCHRIVDRGPPADDTDATNTFVALWGDRKAQLRRFKDGAIVRAVVWDDTGSDNDNQLLQYEGSDKAGRIVENIVRHVIGLHFVKKFNSGGPKFALRDMLSLIDGAVSSSNKPISNSTSAHKDIMVAFDSLSSFLKDNTSAMSGTSGIDELSKLGLPLPINSLEALSSCLRYSELFPPTPHELLGGGTKNTGEKISGVTMGNAILIQICFKKSSKWPLDINAMGAAKCAMLLQLAEGIEKMKGNVKEDMSFFNGPINVTPSHLDLGYRGYPWRIIIRADQELEMLSSLRDPSVEAITLREVLTKRHIINAVHHFTIHGVHSKHPAAMGVVRLAKRWIGAHMLSGLILDEAIELLVVSVFTDPSPLHTPSTVSCGFVRFLLLVASYDWKRNPLIVDPEGHVNSDDRARIISEFEFVRGANFQNGPPMYIVSPSDRGGDLWKPTFTLQNPEKVILSRICALAKRSHQYLMMNIINSEHSNDDTIWMGTFKENSNSLKSYSALLRVNPNLIVDGQCSSTRANSITSETSYELSVQNRSLGPKDLRKRVFKNLNGLKTANAVMVRTKNNQTMLFAPNMLYYY